MIRVFRVFLCVVLLAAASCATKETPKSLPEKVSWEQAVTLIRGGGIEAVMQSHNLQVWMRSKDGRQYLTREPGIDAVARVIREVDPDGKSIRYGTE